MKTHILKYKDSNLAWIGKVPENWRETKLQYEIDVLNGFPFKSNLFEKDKGFPLIRIRDITSGEINTYYTGEYDDSYIIKSGDYIIGMDGDFNSRLWNNKPALLNQRCCKIIVKEDRIYSKFIYYLLPIYLKVINDLTYYTTVKHLSIFDIYEQKVFLPTLKEQTQIAKYLDYQTNIIDQLIEKKEKLAALLKEQRQAIINEAVTKGLDPNAKMNDSGIEWLGEIPEDWEFIPLRYLGVTQNGVSKGGGYFGSGDPFISYGDVYKNFTIPESPKGLANSTAEDKINYSVKKGDVFFTRTSETIHEIGIASTAMNDVADAVFAGFLIRFRPYTGKLIPDYSKYYFRSFVPHVYFTSKMNLVTRASLSQDLLKQLLVCIPPIKEQEEIATYLDKKTDVFDKLIEQSTETIVKLKEYRQSLISEAVTGKIDLREWKVPKKETA